MRKNWWTKVILLTISRAGAVLIGLGVCHAQTKLFELHGKSGEVFSRVSAAGDLDQDGYADFLAAKDGQVWAYSGRTGLMLYTWYEYMVGIGIFEGFGDSLSELGDVDGDGYSDVIVGAPWSSTPTGGSSGAVVVLSGRTGAVIRVVNGPSSSDFFGYPVAAAGDVNLDGWPDFIGGAYGDGSGGTGGGTARVVSGFDGSELHKLEPTIDEYDFGWSVDGGRDIDLDGYSDLVVLQRWRAVYAFSGKNGDLLHVFTNADFPESGWECVALLSDTDGDGYADIAAGEPSLSTSEPRVGGIRLFGGETWEEIRTITGNAAYESLGIGLARAGDVDLDGVEDLIAGATDCYYKPCQGTPPPQARVYSGATGEMLVEVSDQEQPFSGFGMYVDGLGDVNADGRPDLVVGSPYYDVAGVPGYADGRVQVFSSVTMPLSSSEHLLPLATGGTAVMGVHAGASHGGEIYLVLGSLTGTSPGIPAGAGTLPLVPDGYFQFTLAHPTSPPLGAALGVLSSAGTSHPTFAIPPGLPPSDFGLTAWHAAVLLDPVTLAVTGTTNAVPVTLGDESLVH